jgi:ATP synthase protein I
MSKMAFANGFDTNEPEEENFKPLTALEAGELRKRNPSLSPWRILVWQCAAGLTVALLAWGVSGKTSVAWSAGYGALAVIIPAALFARGVMGRFSSLNAATATLGFFIWEAVKLGVSIVMIALAPRLITDLSWLALLAGLLVTMKMYWLALKKRPKPEQI